MRLSKRLETVASFVTQGSNIADIGTDHGYVPIFLVKEGIVCRALAMDVRTGPLKRAESHIRSYGLEEKIGTRLSDGLEKLEPGEADTVIIAGMGGELMIHIMEQGSHTWESVAHWVLSPQSDLDKVRKFLEKNGFCIEREAMLLEDGKFYTVLSVGKGVMSLGKQSYYLYGAALIGRKDPVLRKFLQKEQKQKEAVIERLRSRDTAGARERLSSLEEELSWIEEAMDEMQ